MAERLECWTCNPKDPSSSPTLTASWICFTENLSLKSSATQVNSQLVCLRPVGILKPIPPGLFVEFLGLGGGHFYPKSVFFSVFFPYFCAEGQHSQKLMIKNTLSIRQTINLDFSPFKSYECLVLQ